MLAQKDPYRLAYENLELGGTVRDENDNQKATEFEPQSLSQTCTVALDPPSGESPKFGKVVLPIPLTDEQKRLKPFIESL